MQNRKEGREESVRRKKANEIKDGRQRRNNPLVQAFGESNLPGKLVMSLKRSAC